LAGVVVVVVDEGVEVVVGMTAPDPVVVVVAGVAGGFTEKSVPVVTVTCAPSVVGPYERITAPERLAATACAAASAVGVI
jgi:hypothetical protein